MEDFKQTRINLIDMLEDLGDRLNGISTDEISNEESLENSLDQVFPKDNKMDGDLDTVNYQEIEKIKKAIASIDQGTYGICLVCGQAIKKERLNSIPFSQHCKYCADKKNDY